MIDRVAAGTRLRGKVKGERKRLLTTAFVLRAIVLMTLMPDADAREVLLALAGDLAVVPWARRWWSASPRAFGDWRQALGREPLEELQRVVLGASWQEHEAQDWRAVVVGRLTAGAIDGTLIRMPDTAANRAVFGSTGTSDDSAPFPQLRALMLTDVSTRALFGMPHGPSGGDKAAGAEAAGQGHGRASERVHLGPDLDTRQELSRRGPDRPAHPAHACADPPQSDIRLERTSGFYPDGSYLAQITGDGVTVTVRVIEYLDVEGQDVPEMFCLITDLRDWREYPAADLAGLYRWRWDGSETALREAKSALEGAGPSTGPMFRSTTPDLVRQELAA